MSRSSLRLLAKAILPDPPFDETLGSVLSPERWNTRTNAPTSMSNATAPSAPTTGLGRSSTYAGSIARQSARGGAGGPAPRSAITPPRRVGAGEQRWHAAVVDE